MIEVCTLLLRFKWEFLKTLNACLLTNANGTIFEGVIALFGLICNDM
jgi:hypothetical protein